MSERRTRGTCQHRSQEFAEHVNESPAESTDGSEREPSQTWDVWFQKEQETALFFRGETRSLPSSDIFALSATASPFATRPHVRGSSNLTERWSIWPRRGIRRSVDERPPRSGLPVSGQRRCDCHPERPDNHTIDDYLGLLLPTAGVHGAERRDAQGRMHLVRRMMHCVEPVTGPRGAARRARARAVSRAKAGRRSTLHYRGRPDLDRTASACMDTVANAFRVTG